MAIMQSGGAEIGSFYDPTKCLLLGKRRPLQHEARRETTQDLIVPWGEAA